MLKDTIHPSTEIHKRALTILGKVSFSLDIVSVDVSALLQETSMGFRPVWAIIYQAKGHLLGSEHYITQVTIIGDPFMSDEALQEGLIAGCDTIRANRAQQLNERAK